ncbi:MAG: branched-chain amino acid ABC transporter permease, partial [Candidatus Methanomethylicota archaeon]
MDLMSYVLDAVVFLAIYALLSVSLSLEYGFTGLANFGKVAFFAIGAYVSALLVVFYSIPMPLNVLIGAVASAVAGVVISIPALKLREDYLAIVTISFSEILRLYLLNEEAITGGAFGVRGIPPLFQFGNHGPQYLFLCTITVCIVLASTLIIIHKIVLSPFGRILRAIRDCEVAAEALGKSVAAFKSKTMALGSAIAGLAGGIYAHYLQYISPDMFMPMLTFNIWIMVMLGGRANIFGAVFGAALMVFFERSTRLLENFTGLPIEPHNLRMIVIGLLLVMFMIFKPQGAFEEFN